MKKALNIIKNIFVWAIVVLAIGMMIFTIISVNTFDRNDRDIFGYKFYIVQTDSMSESELNASDDIHFSAGDIVIMKEVDPATLQPGDVIAFTSQNSESYGETITHMIRSLTTDANGNPGFITYGTNTGTDDETIVTYPFVLGKYSAHIPYLGTFFQFLKTTPGYIICIFVPFLILILYQGINCIRIFRRYKKEQMQEMEEERKQIEEDRKASVEMLKELQALKAQLAQQTPNTAAAPADAAPEVAPDTETDVDTDTVFDAEDDANIDTATVVDVD